MIAAPQGQMLIIRTFVRVRACGEIRVIRPFCPHL
jgi:hypothetical protein